MLNFNKIVDDYRKTYHIFEKYYFKSRVNDSKYKITDDKMMECFSLHIKYILELAKEEKIDLNKVSDRTRRKDQESFLWIEKENSNDL